MNNTSGVRRFFDYLPEIIKFHKLKNEGLARIIFVLVLFCQVIGIVIQNRIFKSIPSDDIDMINDLLTMTMPSSSSAGQLSEHVLFLLILVLCIILLVHLITNLFFSVYMYSYISEKRGKDSSLKASIKGTFKNTGRLICYNIIFGLLFLIGFMFFFVPGVIAYVLFVFGYCYVLDLKLNVADAMTASIELVKGKWTQIMGLFLSYFFIFKLPIFIFLSGGSIGASCMVAFFSTISKMILQRLITQIYLDLEYKKEVKKI